MTNTPFEYKVYKNAVPAGQVVNINNVINSNGFPWYLSGDGKDKTVTNDYYETFKGNLKIFESTQLCHIVADTTGRAGSYYKGITDYLLDEFCKVSGFVISEVMRVKLNLQLKVNSVSGEYNTPHTDLTTPHFVVIYYVNSSDGYTTIFKQKMGDDLSNLEPLVKVASEEGTFLLFNGEHYHAGMHPKQSISRIVINFCIRGTLPEQTTEPALA